MLIVARNGPPPRLQRGDTRVVPSAFFGMRLPGAAAASRTLGAGQRPHAQGPPWTLEERAAFLEMLLEPRLDGLAVDLRTRVYPGEARRIESALLARVWGASDRDGVLRRAAALADTVRAALPKLHFNREP